MGAKHTKDQGKNKNISARSDIVHQNTPSTWDLAFTPRHCQRLRDIKDPKPNKTDQKHHPHTEVGQGIEPKRSQRHTRPLIDHDLSDKIIEHDLGRAVTMTGSDGAGSHIGERASKNLKKTVLELGSNDAYLVLEDADIETAVKTCVQGRIYNNGETCVSAKRFVVTDAVYDEFVSAQLGPLSSREQFDTIVEQVNKSLEAGAKLLCGGDPIDGEGCYYPATVLAECKPGMPAYDDELFGPVASVIRAKDDDDAMRIANDSRYGLGGGIFTKDEEKAIRLARDHFDTGMIRINSFGAADPNMPFGGVKDSGYGREHGGFGMKEFVNAKAIFLPS